MLVSHKVRSVLRVGGFCGLVGALSPAGAHATDGVLEINQSCATQAGCFPLDSGGFPVTILTPGSYRLTSSLFGSSESAPVIHIQAEPVTLDLNGFDITGFGFGSQNPAGVGVLGGHRVALHNGSVHHVSGDAVRLGGSSRVEDMHVYASDGAGVVIAGEGTVRGVVATGNGKTGIKAGPASVIADCTATANGGHGIELPSGSVNASTATQNSGAGGAFGNGVSFGASHFAANAALDVNGGHASAGNFCADRTCTTDGRKRYYVTPSAGYDGSDAVLACDVGFHMASLWEMIDPSALQYDFALRGHVIDPASQGPPVLSSGWVRTSAPPSNSGPAGDADCVGWTSANSLDRGTVSYFNRDWTLGALATSPWVHLTVPCNASARVWCVED